MTDEFTNGTLRYRLEAAEKEIARLWDQKASVRDLDAVLKSLEENTIETKSLRKTIMAFTVTLATAAVVFALTVLQGSLA
jgi:hypothetical protein